MLLFAREISTKACSDAICFVGISRRLAPPLSVCPGRTNQGWLVGPRRRQDVLWSLGWSRSSPPKH